MTRIQQLFARLLLAASLLGAAGAAAATPFYHVDIDTRSLGTGPAYLGFYLLGLTDATDATATVNHLAGAFIGAATLDGAATGTPPGPIVFSSLHGGGDFMQAIQLGGMFSFDVDFLLGTGNTGSTFGWALFDDVQYLGADGDLGDINLAPDAPAATRLQLVTSGSPLVHVALVPEPASVTLLLLALAAMACARMRAPRRPRDAAN